MWRKVEGRKVFLTNLSRWDLRTEQCSEITGGDSGQSCQLVYTWTCREAGGVNSLLSTSFRPVFGEMIWDRRCLCPNPTSLSCLAGQSFPGFWRAGYADLHTGKQALSASTLCVAVISPTLLLLPRPQIFLSTPPSPYLYLLVPHRSTYLQRLLGHKHAWLGRI